MQQDKKESGLQMGLLSSFNSWEAGSPFILLSYLLGIWYLSHTGLGLLIFSVAFENEPIAGEF